MPQKERKPVDLDAAAASLDDLTGGDFGLDRGALFEPWVLRFLDMQGSYLREHPEERELPDRIFHEMMMAAKQGK